MSGDENNYNRYLEVQGSDDLSADDLAPTSEEKVLVILKSSADSMKAAEAFLRNRGWTVYATDKLREVLALLIQKQPPYIMIASDHPHKKVKVLPKILTQAFSIKMIGFCEKSSGATINGLQEMGLNYNLFPPVSGPAIERMILRIRKDEQLQTQELITRRPMDSDSTEAPDMTKGSAHVFRGEDGKLITLQGQSSTEAAAAARSALAALMSEDSDILQQSGSASDSDSLVSGGSSTNDPSLIQSGQGSQSGPGFIHASGPRGSQGPAYTPGSGSGESNDIGENGQKARESNPFFGNQTPSGGKSGFYYNPTTKKNEPLPPGYEEGNNGSIPFSSPTGKKRNSDGSIPFSSGKPGDGPGPLGAGENRGPGFQGQQGAGPSHPSGSRESSDSETQSQSPKAPQTAQEKARAQIAKSALVIKGDPADSRSLFEVGVQQSLDQTIDELGDKKLQAGEPHRVVCVTVESGRFNGYLVAAMGKDRALDSKFMDGVKQRLFNFLKSNGENVDEKEGTMDLRIAEVPFQEWSMECANFLVKTIHNQEEIAMAFFPSEDTKVDLEQSVSEKMLQIDLKELREDSVMEFDLYIYMPENQRYLLYTPTGRVLLGEQKNRLVKKGMTHMHLRKENVVGVKRYRAQNFLNDKIAEFKTLQGLKKG